MSRGGFCGPCLTTFFGLMAITFVCLHLAFPSILEAGIRSQLVLVEGNEYIKNWLDIPLPIDYKFYFFNIENPREALAGAKVRVREVGPYWLRESIKRKILKWGPNKETVTFVNLKKFDFMPELSAPLTLDDQLTVVNVPMAGVGAVLGDIVSDRLPLQPVVRPLVFGSMSAFFEGHGEQLFQKFKVRDLIYGYRIRFADTLSSVVDPIRSLGLIPNGLMPEGAPNNTFGLLYGKTLPEGPFEIFTGQDGTSKMFAQFVTWDGKAKLDWWGGDYCNQLRGSDGSQFPLFLKRTDTIWAFNPDVCRSIFVTYEKDTEVMGIPTYRFTLDKKNYANAEQEPENSCFCLHAHSRRPKRCSVGGLFDMGGCAAGAPLALSLPHFGGTSPDISKSQVDGLKYVPENHSLFLDIEPMAGAGYRVAKRLQFSVRLERNTLFRQFQNIRPAFVPFAWAEESGGLTEDFADMLKTMLYNPVTYSEYVLAGGSIAFIALFFTSLCMGKLTKLMKSRKSVKVEGKPLSPVFVKVQPEDMKEDLPTAVEINQDEKNQLKQTLSKIMVGSKVTPEDELTALYGYYNRLDDDVTIVKKQERNVTFEERPDSLQRDQNLVGTGEAEKKREDKEE